MTEFSRKWLPRFAWIVLIVLLIQSIRNDERLLRPVASLIYNISSWAEEATGVKDHVKSEMDKIKKEKHHD